MQKNHSPNQTTEDKDVFFECQQSVENAPLKEAGTSEKDNLNCAAKKADTKCASEKKLDGHNEEKKKRKTKVKEGAEDYKQSKSVKLRNTVDKDECIMNDDRRNVGDNISEEGEASNKKFEKLSTYRNLAENDRIKLVYSVSLSDTENHIVDAGIVFSNKSECFLKQLEVNILDTLNAKLIRDSGSSMGGIVLDFQLPPGISTENTFKFKVDANNVSQRLRGTLTYFVNEGDSVTEEKLDFHLCLPSTLFVVAATIGSDAFEVLLTSGDLLRKSSVQFVSTLSLKDLLRRICFYGHFNVVEKSSSCASLYGQHTSTEPVCLLVKRNVSQVQIDGRGNDEQLLYSLLNDLKYILSG